MTDEQKRLSGIFSRFSLADARELTLTAQTYAISLALSDDPRSTQFEEVAHAGMADLELRTCMEEPPHYACA
jgi:hypothetical protein